MAAITEICCKPLFDNLRGDVGGAVMPSNLAVSFHPTALPAGKVSLICCARKSCQCGRADVHFSGSHYADGRHLTSDHSLAFHRIPNGYRTYADQSTQSEQSL